MRLVSILTYIVLALATPTTVNANLKDLVNKVKDTIKTDVAKIIVQPKTKIIALDSNIVPTWNDVVPKHKHKPIKKITLKTVLNRWNKMEKKSRDAYAALVSSPMDKIQAIAKVTKFYDGSEKCLKQQGTLTRKVNQKTFNALMKAVRKCIDETNAPPTFEVDVNATVPVVVEDDDDEESELDTGGSNTADSTGGGMNNSGSGSDSSDNGSDATPTMVPTLTPTAAPTQESTKAPTEAPTDAQKGDVDSLTDVFHSSAEDSKADVADNSEPDVVHESNNAESSTDPYESNPDTIESTLEHPLSDDSDKSISNTSIEETSTNHTIVNDEVQLQPTSADDQVTNIPYVYKPSLAQVAPFSALDVNGDGQMTPDEWTIYVTGLHDAAYSRVEKGKDDRAKRMIKNVIEFHYSILGGCINNNVGTQSLKDDATFQAVVKTIENNCYVKFRYSLLAGPPPFEWVAKRNATVTPSQIEEWFNKVVNQAKTDIKNKRIITLTRAEQEEVEHVMDCIYKVLGTCTASALNRDLYYTELDQVGNCVASFTN